MTVRFSVITVVLNDFRGLVKTRKSLEEQSYPNVDWIVCDGGSIDGSVAYLEKLLGVVKWRSGPDSGIYDAMNHGVAMASGDYVVFMNAGDTFHDSNTLAKVAQALASGPKAVDILFGGALLSFPDSGRLIYRAPRHAESSIWHGVPANHQATYYRREMLGSTPYDLQYRLCGDYYLSALLYKRGSKAAYLNEPLAIFEVGGQSYKMLRKLFVEPYLIQRDVLGMPFYYRWASFAKRLVSTAAFVLLSQSFFYRKNK